MCVHIVVVVVSCVVVATASIQYQCTNANMVLQNPLWYLVLSSIYDSKYKPELQVTLTIKGVSKASMVVERSRQAVESVAPLLHTSDRSLYMHPCGRHYQLGPVEMSDQYMFTITMTLSNPIDLPPVSL